jgi:hypothetical protein
MTCDPTSFGVMDLDSGDLSNLRFLNIEKATNISRCEQLAYGNLLDIMSRNMSNSPDQ